jgi:chromosome segregation ATPase
MNLLQTAEELADQVTEKDDEIERLEGALEDAESDRDTAESALVNARDAVTDAITDLRVIEEVPLGDLAGYVEDVISCLKGVQAL